MRLNFRQGLVSHQPAFLSISGPNVVINAVSRPVLMTVAHGRKDYLFEEPATITAWNDVAGSSVPVWLYWDFDTRTFERRFGSTTVEPVFSHLMPATPTNGQHWFDTATNFMMEYTMNGWRKVIRVFAAKLESGTFQSLGTDPGAFTGSQVGISNVRYDTNNQPYVDRHIFFDAGNVLFDDTGAAVRAFDGSFMTASDKFFVSGSKASTVNLESSIVPATCAAPALARNSVVVFTAPGQITTCQYENVGSALIGVLTEDLVNGETGSVIVQGMVHDETWNWSTMNVPLWVNNGQFTTSDPHVAQPSLHPAARPPVARISDTDSVFFMQGLGLKGDPGADSAGVVGQATTSNLGTVRLNLSHPDAVVVVDTDSRMTDARVPLPHVHPAAEVTMVPVANVPDTNVQSGLASIGTALSGKVNRAGDTMTGPFSLSSNPTQPMHAATKTYVDSVVTGLNVIDPLMHVNLIADNLPTPPSSPNWSDVYIVPINAQGVWTGLEGHVVVWDGAQWIDRGLLTVNYSVGDRFGVAIETTSTPIGSFSSKKNQVAVLDSVSPVAWSFYTPSKSDAFFVKNTNSLHAFHQYVYTGTAWAEFGKAAAVTPGTNLELVGTVLSVSPQGPASNLHADLWDGQHAVVTAPQDLDSLVWDSAAGTAGAWVNQRLMLEDIGNVTIVTQNDGDVLKWDSGLANWVTGPGLSNAVVTDTNFTWPATPYTGAVITSIYDGGTGTVTWQPTEFRLENLINYRIANEGQADGTMLIKLADGNWTDRDINATAKEFINLTDIKNVSAAAPTTGQVLSWNGTNWVPATPTSGGATSLDGLSDVTLNPYGSANGDMLIFNSGSGQWVNTPAKLDALIDVTINSYGVATGSLLQFNGSQWVDVTNINMDRITQFNSMGTFNNLEPIVFSWNDNKFHKLTDGATGGMDFFNYPLKHARLDAYYETFSESTASTSTLSIDLETGGVQKFTLTTNITTINLSHGFGLYPGCYSLTLILKQDATGSRTVVWPAVIKWPNSTAPTLTTTANRTDIFTLITYDQGATWIGFVAGQNINA